MKSIKKVEFEAHCKLEGTWGERKLGKRQCSLEVFDHENGKNLMIEFIAGEDCEHIGLSYDDNKNIYDYDGVFSVPVQAIDMLNELGYKTDDIE